MGRFGPGSRFAVLLTGSPAAPTALEVERNEMTGRRRPTADLSPTLLGIRLKDHSGSISEG